MEVARVLHIISGLDTGGAEMMLYKVLAQSSGQKVKSTVISLKAPGPIAEKIEREGVDVQTLHLGKGFWRLAICLPILIWKTIRFRPSVIQGWMYHGNLAALLIPINFSILIIFIRKNPKLDMIPAIFYSGILSAIYGFILSENIIISYKDLGLAFLLGVPQLAFGFIFVTIGSRTTPAATVGLLMLTESIFGPIWGWIIFTEIPPVSVFIAGFMIVTAVVVKSLERKKYIE